MVTEQVIEKINNLPMTPGVYLWRDQYHRIIYVGKAINLRNRVRSYVKRDPHRAVKVKAMMQRAVDVEIIQTETEMEALILENNLIKKHHPKYNILMRDDKTYPYAKVTVQEDFPRLFLTRRILRDGAKYYGPYTDVGALHRTIDIFHKYFPLRTCRSMNVTRPCLQYHIGRCLAPCVYPVDTELYGSYIEQIKDLFEGKRIPLQKELKETMEQVAEALDFERAASLRDDLKALQKMQEKQRIVSAKGDMDIIGVASINHVTSIQIFFVRQGHLLGRENFFTPSKDETCADIVTGFLQQFYGDHPCTAKEVLLPFSIEGTELLEEWLSSMTSHKVRILVPQRGHKKDLIDMAQGNANTYLEEKKRQWQHQIDRSTGALEKLQNALDLPRLPERMECFDISHFQGRQTVASMVVFEQGKPAKKEYRRFKLKTTQGKPDDFQSMAEVMERRYGNETDWPKPDLIIIDGGKGQLSASAALIRRVGVDDVPIISLAKRIEEVFVEGESESIILSHHSPELQLLQQIRDEAHRFAITYHRKWRQKKALTSILDVVEGVGPKRRQALFKTFKSIDAMKEASVEELAAVEGMNETVAKAVYDFLKASKDEKQLNYDL